MAKAFITISFRKREVEADGSACLCCGDAIYLKAYNIEAYADGKKIGELVGGLTCQACAESMKGIE